MVTEFQDKIRAAVYIDGFNLYHPIKEIGDEYLKWNDLWRLSENLCAPQKLSLQKVAFCTAVPAHYPDSRDRHNLYNAALIAKGVKVIKGHHVFEESAGKYREKQSDINVCLELLFDGLDDIYDVAYLISADSDQAATAKRFVETFGKSKSLISVAPPNKKVPQKMRPYIAAGFALTRQDIENVVMEPFVKSQTGALIRMPKEYETPEGWVHPDKRRK